MGAFPGRRFAVVILNWNGAADTLECLWSVLREPGAFPIVVDNGSRDGSLQTILSALAAQSVDVLSVPPPSSPGFPSSPGAMCMALVALPENLGFAGGSNVGLQCAVRWSLDVCVFLNNDTWVEPCGLERIVDRVRTDAGCFACLPMLVVYGTRTVWNCGGTVSRWGVRRYFHSGEPRERLSATPEIPCSFFTGCCFAVRTSAFATRGGFTERFFFGEEDFELSLWMKDRGLLAVCLLTAVVQHKVSSSFSRAAADINARKLFVYYLNRFIHMRLRLGAVGWTFWLLGYIVYTATLLLRVGAVQRHRIPGFLWCLVRRARRMDGVRREEFEAIMQGRW